MESPVHNRAEAYFREFTRLLGEHYRRERSVGFYARQLCITPKYLTTLIKHISGKSVSDWIDSYVTLEAKTLLKYSNMSVGARFRRTKRHSRDSGVRHGNAAS